MVEKKRVYKCVILPLFIAFIFLVKEYQCQCLLNRLGCTLRNPSSTAVPGDDECGIYSSRIVERPQGLVCELLRKNHQIRTLDTIGDSPLLKYIFSPGRELPTPVDYGNRLYVQYEMVCPEGYNVIQYSITEIDMEEANCPNPNSGVDECVDYIRFLGEINGESIGDIEYCGPDEDPTDNVLHLHPSGRLSAILRTSDGRRFPGFKASMICVNETEAGAYTADVEGSGDDMTGDLGRRKRDVDEFNDMWRKRLNHYIRRERENFGGRFKRIATSLRFVETIVPFGSNLNYQDRELVIKQASTSTVTRTIPGIRWLHTFDARGVIRHYDGEASNLLMLIDFPGAGPLTVVGDNAYFILFLVDPQGILPETEAERYVLRVLRNAHFDRILEFPDEELCEDLLNPPPEEELITRPDCPLPVTTEPLSCNVTDEILRVAVRGQTSRNILIRTVANVITNCTRRTQPGRIEGIDGTRTQPLNVRCNIVVDEIQANISVSCESNRRTGGVRISRCDIDGRTSILEFCNYPTFVISTFDLSPSRHALTMRFTDSVEIEDSETISFVTDFDFTVTCVIIGIPGEKGDDGGTQPPPLVINNATVACMSNVGEDAIITVESCLVDDRLRVACSFPVFEFIVPQGISLGARGHSLTIVFRDERGLITQEEILFRIS